MAIKATPTLRRYLKAGRDAGCPPDQMRRFVDGGYIALPAQLPFHAAARLADLPNGPVEIGDGGARGGGKSHATMGQVALDDCQRAPGLEALFIRNVGLAARQSFEKLIDHVVPFYRSGYEPGNSRLVFPNGSILRFGGFRTDGDIDKYLGMEYDLIAIEEATLLTDYRMNMIRGSLRTSKPNWRPRMYLTANPGGVGHQWFKARFIDPRRSGSEDRTRFIFAVARDNPHLNAEYHEYLENLPGWLGRAWRDGDWDIAAGQFFTTFSYETHVLSEAVPPDQRRHWRYWLAMDYGWTHWTVIQCMAEDGDGRIYHVFEHAERRWLVERHAQALRERLREFGIEPAAIEAFVAGADVFAQHGTGGGSIADQWATYGWQLEPANDDRVNGAAEYLRRLGDARAGIPPTMFYFPNCRGIIGSLPSLEHDPRRPEDVLKVDTDEEGNGGDDYYDASRYGVMFAKRRVYKAGVQRYA